MKKTLHYLRDEILDINVIMRNSVDDTKFDEELDKADASLEGINDAIIELQCAQEKCEAETATSSAAAAVNTSNLTHNQCTIENPLTIKLPTLTIDKYNGDPLKFQEFWDQFKSSIHEHPQLRDIDKLKYLKSYLEGDALKVA